MRKREIVFAIGAGALAAGAAAAILSDGDWETANPAVFANESGEQTYQLADFERIATTGPQDVEIAYGETYSVRAEGAIGRLAVAVENGELIIGPREGWDFPALGQTTLYVTLPRLTRVALNGTGDVSIDGIKSDRFVGVIEGSFGGNIDIKGLEVDEAEFTINNGPGEITAAGTARTARVTINGVGEIKAGDLQSQRAVVAVRGPGEVELAVEQEADVTVDGPGEVDIDGPARCTVSTSGPGSVSCGNQDGG